MDLTLSEQQELLQKLARDFLRKECTKTLVRDMEEDERGYSPQLWSKMADLGWMGLVIPQQYGGIGGDILDLVILLEEMGRALVPGPFVPTVVYSSLPIVHFGTESQKEELLPKIASGNLIMTLALTETDGGLDEANIQTRATENKNRDYLLEGTKLFVPDAHIADYLLCAARAAQGTTLFLVPGKDPGLSSTPLKTIAADKQFEVIFDKAVVPGKNILGKVGQGGEIINKLKDWGAIAQCALILGGVQQVLEIAVEYAKQRVQFGRPIGSFQAIQHQCADMSTDIDGLKLLTYQAAWKLTQDLPATIEVSMAKAWASDAARKICLQGHKICGGVGIMKDHDMQLYFRKTKIMELAFGNADLHREVVAERIGL